MYKIFHATDSHYFSVLFAFYLFLRSFHTDKSSNEHSGLRFTKTVIHNTTFVESPVSTALKKLCPLLWMDGISVPRFIIRFAIRLFAGRCNISAIITIFNGISCRCCIADNAACTAFCIRYISLIDAARNSCSTVGSSNDTSGNFFSLNLSLIGTGRNGNSGCSPRNSTCPIRRGYITVIFTIFNYPSSF